MPDGNSDVVPPESIPNSEVKRVSGDGSVGSPHVRVAHRQAPNYEEARSSERAFFVSVLCSESHYASFKYVDRFKHRICTH